MAVQIAFDAFHLFGAGNRFKDEGHACQFKGSPQLPFEERHVVVCGIFFGVDEHLDLGRTARVRPENIRISCDLQDGGRGISAVVDLIEPLGSETLVHCITELRNIRVTVRVQNDGSFPIRQIKHSDRIVLLPDMDRVIVFDREGV